MSSNYSCQSSGYFLRRWNLPLPYDRIGILNHIEMRSINCIQYFNGQRFQNRLYSARPTRLKG